MRLKNTKVKTTLVHTKVKTTSQDLLALHGAHVVQVQLNQHHPVILLTERAVVAVVVSIKVKTTSQDLLAQHGAHVVQVHLNQHHPVHR
jgi:D-hexose-6-phosphate mutarotase